MLSKAGRHFEETIDYVRGLQRFLEKNVGLPFAELVCDFIK